MRFVRWFSVPVAALLLIAGSALHAAEPEKKSSKEVASFGTLQAPSLEAARNQALAWLKGVGKTDDKTLQQFDAIWKSDRGLLEMVADTLCLGDDKAAKLMAEARDINAPAPTETPALLKDAKLPVYYRANLTLAYAKALSNRRIYEESLEAMMLVKGDQVIDPATYFFHRAVAEHSLMLRRQADESIIRLLDDVGDAPERYKMVAALMHFDMLTWQDKDLGWIARKMDNIQRRLDLTRGGKKTQQMQKEVLVRLDEMIKEKENQQNKKTGNGGCWPSGGNPGSSSGPPKGQTPSSPASDFGLPEGNNPGLVDPKAVKDLAEKWGTLPEKDRAKAMLELTRGLDPKYRDAIETYIKTIAARTTPQDK